MDIGHAYSRFRSFGGIRLLKEYYHLGIIGALVRKAVECLVHRRSLKNVYAVVSERAAERLKESYSPLIERPTPEIVNPSSLIEHRTVVWFCWLQGMEAVPEMVRVCYESVCRYLPDKEVVLIDEENFGDYVALPEFIMEKRKKGFIPAALFSDILRLELLIKYGGTWIDSTVLMTDPRLS